MLQCIAALFGFTQNLLQGLFRAPRGRHQRLSAKRRRSRRVRRYAPALPTQPAGPTAPPAPSPERAHRDRRPTSARKSYDPPRSPLAPPTVRVSADEVALVRPYLSAYERTRTRQEDDRQRTAAGRLAAWGADPMTLDSITGPITFDDLADPTPPRPRRPAGADPGRATGTTPAPRPAHTYTTGTVPVSRRPEPAPVPRHTSGPTYTPGLSATAPAPRNTVGHTPGSEPPAPTRGPATPYPTAVSGRTTTPVPRPARTTSTSPTASPEPAPPVPRSTRPTPEPSASEPAPPPPEPVSTRSARRIPSRMEELPHLSRLRRRQQQRLAQETGT